MNVVGMMVITSLTLVGGLVDDPPYCAVRYRRLCRGKGQHIGCQFPNPGPGVSCVNYVPIKFQDNLKNYVTHYINRRRQRIAAGTERVRGGLHLPKPQIMMMVEWDRELASLAQRLADQCNFVHDECRATVRFPYAGQTVGEVRWRRSSDSEVITAQRAIRRVFDAWWGERRRVLPNQLTAPFRLTAKGAVWGHFSQLAVWSLRAVGCGAVRHGAQSPRLLLVCDFSHTNMLGQRTIAPGPLVRCPAHTERRARSSFPLLCAPVRQPVPAEHYESESDDSSDEEDEEDFITSFPVHPINGTRQLAYLSSTKTRHVTRTIDETIDWRTSSLYLGARQSRTPSKGSLVHKLDRELEVRQKAHTKVMLKHFFGDTRWIKEDDARLGFVKTHLEDNVRRVTTGRTTSLNEAYEREAEYRRRSNSSQFVVRHKWQATRDRPKRPGASALLHPATVHTRQPVGSLTLDKEDIDQLFRDTGFNPSWVRNHPPP